MEDAPPVPPPKGKGKAKADSAAGSSSNAQVRVSKREKKAVVKYEAPKPEKKPMPVPAPAPPAPAVDGKRGRGPNGESTTYKKRKMFIDCTGDGFPIEKSVAKEGESAPPLTHSTPCPCPWP